MNFRFCNIIALKTVRIFICLVLIFQHTFCVSSNDIAPSLSKEVIEGLSPAAAAASSLIKKGMTLSQVRRVVFLNRADTAIFINFIKKFEKIVLNAIILVAEARNYFKSFVYFGVIRTHRGII